MPTASNPILDPDRVGKLIKAAREHPVFFAVGLGATPDKNVVAADKTKAGKVLLDICRKEGGARKGAYGTVLITDEGAVFTCEKNEVPALGKVVLLYFKANKINLKAEIVEAGDAEATETETEETPERPADTEKRAAPPDEEDGPEDKIYDPDAIIALIRRARSRSFPFAFGVSGDRPLLAVHPRMDPGRMARMIHSEGATRGVWGSVGLDGSVAVFTCEKAPYPGVKKGLRQWFKDQRLNVKVRVQGPEGEFADPEDESEEAAGEDGDATARMAALRARGLELLPGLRALERTDPGRAKEIDAQLREFGQAVKGADVAHAEALLERLEQLSGGTGTAQGPDPDRLRAARDAWNDAVEDTDRQLTSLVDVLRRTGNRDLADVADKIPTSVFGNTRVPLTAALMDLARATGGSRDAAAAKALKAAGRLRGHLAGDPQVLACDDNPFGVPVSLRATLGRALDAIETTIRGA